MSLVKNYIYNLVYQIFNILLPVITIPYVSRILGKEGLGITAYTNSIVTYFVILGSLGIGTYATREIACVRDNDEELKKTFVEVFILKLVMGIMSFTSYTIIFVVFNKEYKLIYLVQSIQILSSLIDISWLYIGLEKIKEVAIRSFIIKILGLIGVFCLVRQPSDIINYIFVLAFSVFIGQIIMWYGISRYFKDIDYKTLEFREHFKKSIKFFIPQIAVQIYTVLDKTMLGLITNTSSVGMYENAEKLVKMLVTIITTLSSVMIPRLSNIFVKGNNEKIKNYVENIFSLTTFFAIPLSFGISGIAKEFSPWFFGEEFDGIHILIQILSLIVIAITWQTVIGAQYLVSVGKIDMYSKIIFIGAGVNFIINLIVIGKLEAIGVTISTVISEFLIAIIMLYKVKDNLSINNLMNDIYKNIVSAFGMFFVIRYIGIKMGVSPFTTITQFIIGSSVYILLSVILKVKSAIDCINFIKYNLHRKNKLSCYKMKLK